MTGVHKKTIMKLLVEIGTRCQHMLDEKMRGLRFEVVECDEIWMFIQKKEGVMKAAVALYFWTYNVCLIHGSLRMTPAMAADITDGIWELQELVA